MLKISDRVMKRIEKEKSCIGCKACMKGCPMLDSFCDSPKQLLKELSDKGAFELKLPYSCMLCGYCTKVCPKGVDLKDLFLELRRDAVNQANGSLPKELKAGAVKMHQRLSFSKLFSSDIMNLQSDTVFFPGCALVSYSPGIVRSTYAYLTNKIPGTGLYVKCCGKPTGSMGCNEKFKEYYSSIDKELKARKVKKLITACQNCYMTISANSSGIEVLSLWEVLAEHGIPDGKSEIGKAIPYGFTIHDPCPARNIGKIHEAVRGILKQAGIEAHEMEYSRGYTLCCGSGGMAAAVQRDIAQAHSTRRAGEASTDYIITYCQECVESLRRGGGKTIHILDLLFNDELYYMQQKNNSVLSKWLNRYRGKKLL